MKTSFIRLPLAIFSMNMAASGFLYARSGFPMAPSSTRWFQQSLYLTSLAARKEPYKDNCEFELQELRAQLNAIKAKGIGSKDLDPFTRAAFANYARQIVAKRPSPIALSSVAAQLPGSSWRLVFSTEAATLGALPKDATVYLHFVDEANMDYSLRFSEKTFGLEAITAHSKWTGDARGVITFVYDKITTNVFGFKNVGVSFSGCFKGGQIVYKRRISTGTFGLRRRLARTARNSLACISEMTSYTPPVPMVTLLVH